MAHIQNIINEMTQPDKNSNPSQPITPPLEKLSPVEADSCPECGDTGFFRYDVLPGDPNFGKLAPCEHPSHSEKRLTRLASVSGLDKADLSRRLKDIKQVHYNVPQDGVDNWTSNRAMLMAARQMIDNPSGMLFIWGGPGNAKSEVLIAIVNELSAKGYGTVMYTKLSKIVDYMRDAFSEQKYRDSKGLEAQDLGYIARFNRLKAVKVLAIDEMDKIKNLTSFVEDFRFDFLDDRYRQAARGETVTIFAGNGDPADLPMPIYDRIREFTIVENTAPSARPHIRR